MSLRPDLALVADLIPRGSRVLDLGCGSGELLAHLIGEAGCRGTGVEIDPEQVVAAIRLGVPVIELDMDSQLDDFSDHSYDVVVLSRTVQTLHRPATVLRHMGRIADQLIVSVPNFGYWQHRLRLLAGRMPMGRDLPYSWYDSPNLRFTTLVEMEELFAKEGLQIERRIPLTPTGRPITAPDRVANLLAGAAVYSLRA